MFDGNDILLEKKLTIGNSIYALSQTKNKYLYYSVFAFDVMNFNILNVRRNSHDLSKDQAEAFRSDYSNRTDNDR